LPSALFASKLCTGLARSTGGLVAHLAEHVGTPAEQAIAQTCAGVLGRCTREQRAVDAEVSRPASTLGAPESVVLSLCNRSGLCSATPSCNARLRRSAVSLLYTAAPRHAVWQSTQRLLRQTPS